MGTGVCKRRAMGGVGLLKRGRKERGIVTAKQHLYQQAY